MIAPVVVVVSFLASFLAPQTPPRIVADQKQAALRIVVLAGEDAVNVIQQKTAVAPLIEVRDRNNLPVAGATVTFAVGPGATFGGGSTLTVVTNAAGQAVATGLSPTAAGAIQVQATAIFQGQTAVATIAQSNVLTAAQAAQAVASTGASSGGGGAAGGGGLSPGVVGGVAGAAVAGGLAVVTLGKEETPQTPSLSIARSPTGAGIQGVTVFTFTATSENIASPTYTWDFGDGGTAVGQTVTHVYTTDGTYQAALRTAASQGATASVTVGSLSQTWVARCGGTQACSPGNSNPVFIHRLEITQQGASLSGQWMTETLNSPVRGNSPLSGTVSSSRAITFTQGGECLRTFTGTIDENLTTFTGQAVPANPNCEGAGFWVFGRQ